MQDGRRQKERRNCQVHVVPGIRFYCRLASHFTLFWMKLLVVSSSVPSNDRLLNRPELPIYPAKTVDLIGILEHRRSPIAVTDQDVALFPH